MGQYTKDAARIIAIDPGLSDAVVQGWLAIPEAKQALKLRLVAPDLYEQIKTGTISVKAAIRAQRRRERPLFNSAVPLPEGKYDVIASDPPWRYDFCAADANAIENHYPTMALAEICKLPVGDHAPEHAKHNLWTTGPQLRDAFQVMDAWGFAYTACAVWGKSGNGMGYYYRQNTEHLLVGKRGEPGTPEPGNRPSSLILADKGAHSAKPSLAYEQIEAMYPGANRLELFGRSPRPGWTVWGNEVGVVLSNAHPAAEGQG
jgi:N6-adenosine-specific RNA methylase IME4